VSCCYTIDHYMVEGMWQETIVCILRFYVKRNEEMCKVMIEHGLRIQGVLVSVCG